MTRIEALLGFLGEAALGRLALGHAAAGVAIHRVLPPSGLKKRGHHEFNSGTDGHHNNRYAASG